MDEAIDGAAGDGTYGVAHRAGHLAKFGLIIMGKAAYERHNEVATLVRRDVETEEIGEIVHHEASEFQPVGQMAVHVFRQRGKKAVGQRLTIDLIDDFGQSETRFIFKPVDNFF